MVSEPHILGVGTKSRSCTKRSSKGSCWSTRIAKPSSTKSSTTVELDEYGQATNKIKDDAKYHYLAALRYIATASSPRHRQNRGNQSLQRRQDVQLRGKIV